MSYIIHRDSNGEVSLHSDFSFNSFEVERIISNPPATIVFWKDGTKTVVKTSANDYYSLYHGFCAALAKRIYGSSSAVKRTINDHSNVPLNSFGVSRKEMLNDILGWIISTPDPADTDEGVGVISTYVTEE